MKEKGNDSINDGFFEFIQNLKKLSLINGDHHI